MICSIRFPKALAKRAHKIILTNITLSKRTVADGLILHSDRGSQYTSKEYNDYLEHHCIKHSYSAKGCPYDNSCIESFYATIKKECIYAETNVGYKDF